MISAIDLLRGKRYTHEKAALMTELCDLIYFKKGKATSYLRYEELGFTDIKWFENIKTDTQCIVLSNSDSIVIVCRGSESDRDWQTNFELNQTNTKKSYVHAGFYKAMSSVFDYIVNYIKGIPEYRAKDLYVTGHSLGGALSANFGYFIDDIIRVESVWMLGCPRWASPMATKIFNKQLRKRSFRIVYNNDIVTRIPFKIMIKKWAGWVYRHVGKLIYISANDKVFLRSWGILRILDRIWGRIKNPFEILTEKKQKGYTTKTGWIDEIDDHHPYKIFNAFAKAAKCKDRLEAWEEYRTK